MLAQLTKEENEELESFLKRVSLKENEVLYRAGDGADGVFFLQYGRLAVMTRSGFAEKERAVALLDPGAVVGEGALAGRVKRGMTVTAVEASELLFLSIEKFSKLEEYHLPLASKILKVLLRAAVLRLTENSKRLAHVL